MSKHTDKERVRKARVSRLSRQRARNFILDVKKSGCTRCSENHPACLQFHHKNPSTKIDRVNRIVSQSGSIEKIKIEIEKCEILCANCHAKEHWKQIHGE